MLLKFRNWSTCIDGNRSFSCRWGWRGCSHRGFYLIFLWAGFPLALLSLPPAFRGGFGSSFFLTYWNAAGTWGKWTAAVWVLGFLSVILFLLLRLTIHSFFTFCGNFIWLIFVNFWVCGVCIQQSVFDVLFRRFAFTVLSGCCFIY